MHSQVMLGDAVLAQKMSQKLESTRRHRFELIRLSLNATWAINLLNLSLHAQEVKWRANRKFEFKPQLMLWVQLKRSLLLIAVVVIIPHAPRAPRNHAKLRKWKLCAIIGWKRCRWSLQRPLDRHPKWRKINRNASWWMLVSSSAVPSIFSDFIDWLKIN